MVDGLIYFVTAGAAVSLTRFDGGVAFIWVAAALLIGRLITSPPCHWHRTILWCSIGSILAGALLGIGPSSALPLAAINIGEAVLGAWLLRRAHIPNMPFQSLGWLANFVVAIGIAAPACSALAGASVVHLATGAPWGSSVVNWFTGHALGNLTFTPIAILLLRGDVKRWHHENGAWHTGEALLLLLLVLLTSVGVFAQAEMPLLFLPMLPLILITFRVGRFGAAASVVILALVGSAFTLGGHGPVALMHAPLGARLQFLQFYLAASVLTVLPVAADLARRSTLFRALRDSEARYRLLAETSTDIILNLDPDGRIRFVSPSIKQLGGYEPADLLGRNAMLLVAPEHAEVVREAHLQTLAANGEPVSVEYLGISRSGDSRWFETHARAIVNEAGQVDGIVSVVRDIAARKQLESQLEQDALTDPVTGLPNRRAFLSLLNRQFGEGQPGTGCVALFDLDHFKRINDSWGHAAGDAVLRCFAQTARRTIRGADQVARIGGEEFAILLPTASPDQAQLVCERLRHAVSTSTTHHEGAAIQVTVSGGVAPIHDTAEATLKAADIAMYRAKADGRDRLSMAA